MTYRDKNVGSCDHCLDTDAFIVGNDSDGNYCDKCEAVIVTDEDLAPAFSNDYRQRIHASVAALVITALGIGVLLGYVVTISARGN